MCEYSRSGAKSRLSVRERERERERRFLPPPSLPPPPYRRRRRSATAALVQLEKCTVPLGSHHHSTKTTPPPDLPPHHHQHQHPAGVRVSPNSPLAPRDLSYPYLYRCPPLIHSFSHNGASLSPQYKWTWVSASSAAFQTGRERKTSSRGLAAQVDFQL